MKQSLFILHVYRKGERELNVVVEHHRCDAYAGVLVGAEILKLCWERGFKVTFTPARIFKGLLPSQGFLETIAACSSAEVVSAFKRLLDGFSCR